MLLHYIWVQEFKNIKQQGFSFSDQLTVDYNPGNKKLSIMPNPKHIPNFFSAKVQAVTGIIGANGAGKSNLFEFVKYLLASFSENSSTVYEVINAVVVFEGYVFSHVDIEISNEAELSGMGFELIRFKDSLSNFVDENSQDLPTLPEDDHKIFENSYIYYSGIFDGREDDYLFELMDISTNFLLNSATNEPRYVDYRVYQYGPKIDSLTAYHIFETERQIDFLANNELELPIKLPNSVLIQVEEKHNKNFEDIKTHLQENGLEEFSNIVHFRWGDTESSDPLVIKRIYRRMFIYKLLIVLQYRKPRIFDNVGRDEFEQIIFDDQDELLVEILRGAETLDIRTLLEKLDEVLEVSSGRKRRGVYDSLFEYFDVIDMPLDEDRLPLLLQFFKAYDQAIGAFGFLAFHWEGLSSGELAIFNIYARFNYAFQFAKVANSKHVVILLDEVETNLHPAWQIRLLNDLLYFFNKKLQEKTLQIILTSHSPFLVSDLPKTMINFLDKDEDGNCVIVDALLNIKNTFGANVNTLYTDSFFLNQTLMGEFAKGKIDRLIRVINHERGFDEEFPDWKVCQHYVDIVGEPLLKNYLQKQLNHNLIAKQEDLLSLRGQMELLQQRIDKLEEDNDTH